MSPCVSCGRSTRAGLDLHLVVLTIPLEGDMHSHVDGDFEIAICPGCAARIVAGDRIVGRLEEEDHP